MIEALFLLLISVGGIICFYEGRRYERAKKLREMSMRELFGSIEE